MTPYEYRARCWYGDCQTNHAREVRINAGVRETLRRFEENKQRSVAIKSARLELTRQYKNGDTVVTPDGIGTFGGVDEISGSAIVILNRRKRTYNPEVLELGREPCC